MVGDPVLNLSLLVPFLSPPHANIHHMKYDPVTRVLQPLTLVWALAIAVGIIYLVIENVPTPWAILLIILTLLTTWIPAAIISGMLHCIVTTLFPQRPTRTIPDPLPQPTLSTTQTYSHDERTYGDALMAVIADLANPFETIQSHFTKRHFQPSVAYDPSWRHQVTQALAAFKVAASRLASLSPPPLLTDADTLTKQLAKAYREFATIGHLSIMNPDDIDLSLRFAVTMDRIELIGRDLMPRLKVVFGSELGELRPVATQLDAPTQRIPLPSDDEWNYHSKLNAILPELRYDYELLKDYMNEFFAQTNPESIAEVIEDARHCSSKLSTHCTALRQLQAPSSIQIFDAHVANLVNQFNVFTRWVESNLDDPTNEWLGRHDPKKYSTTDLLFSRLEKAFEEKFYEPLEWC